MIQSTAMLVLVYINWGPGNMQKHMQWEEKGMRWACGYDCMNILGWK